MVKDEKLKYFWGSLKNRIFWGGSRKKQYRGGNSLKMGGGAWTFCRFMGGGGGVGKKHGGLIPQCTL